MKNLQNVLNNYRTVATFIVLTVLITLIFGSIYCVTHQIYRANANDPQVEVTNQVADVINQNVPLDAIVSEAEQIDMAQSLSLFVMIFDKDKKLIGSSAVIDGQTPTPSDQAFEVAKSSGDKRFTWEPKTGVKVAAVLKMVGDKGYVLAGRSLKEVETRQAGLIKTLAIGWAASVLSVAVLSLLLKPRQSIAIIEETNVTILDDSSADPDAASDDNFSEEDSGDISKQL